VKTQRLSNRLAVAAAWAALLLGAALGVSSLVPPTPPIHSNPDDFSVVRALETIKRIAREPRPIGSPANQRVRDDITGQLRRLGLEPQVQAITAPDYFGEPGGSVEVVNVAALIPGTASTSAVALVGHYDTVPTTLGANDNASAVAILLETARAILVGPPLRNDVILLFTDGEEPAPRFGSSAFVEQHPWVDQIGFVINLETVGSEGPSTITGMSGPGRWVIDRYSEAVPYPTAFSFLTTTAELIGGSNTDFEPFLTAGIAGVEFAYLHGSPIYHTMADAPERVSLRSLHQQGANTLALIRHMGDQELGPTRDDSNAVFFSLGRYFIVRYPITWALPIALLAGVVLITAGWRQGEWLGILRSFGATLAMIIISIAAGAGIWTVLAGRRGTMGVAESYLYLAGLLVLTAGISILMARLTRRQAGTMPDATGVVAVWWLLGLSIAIFAPGMSYLFVWPSLAGGLALLWRTTQPTNPRWLPVFSGLVTGTALALLIPVIDTFYQLAQPRPGNLDSQILFIAAISVLFMALFVELFRVFWLRPSEHSS
jgi:hypothetical protein